MHQHMEERNARLAKENNALKTSIAEGVEKREDILRRCVKAEYYSNVSYRRVVDAIDEGIRCLKECLDSCESVKAKIETHYRQLPANITGADGRRAHIGSLSGRVPGMDVLREKNAAGTAAKRAGKRGPTISESGSSSRAARWLGLAVDDFDADNDGARPGTPCLIPGTAPFVDSLGLESANNALLLQIMPKSLEDNDSLARGIHTLKQAGSKAQHGSERNRDWAPEAKKAQESAVSTYNKSSKPCNKSARGERFRTLRAFKRPKR